MKKLHRYIVAIILLVIIFFSCQKEFSIEGGKPDLNTLGGSSSGQ